MSPILPVWGQRFQSLPATFYRPVQPTPVNAPHCLAWNAPLASSLGLAPDGVAALLPVLAGCAVPADCQPVAALYAGHQFGVYVPQLGDGRALLLGDLPHADGRMELQLKGAGPTPFSRMGDGRAVLRSSIREYLASEAMHGLGIPTTRALCLVGAEDVVWREGAERIAVLTRVAPSFVRFGSFEVLYHRGQHQALQQLADYVIEHHFPACLTDAQPYAAWFSAVCQRTAELVAAWQAVGFCHGVMNSDNMSILGLTLDYGPFGFLDAFDAGHICNHSDHAGRYSYQQQPAVAHWNLYCLANALLPLLPEATLLETLAQFPGWFEQAWLARWRAKLGLSQQHADDADLVQALLALLQAQAVDLTLFFRRLSHWSMQADDSALAALFVEPGAWRAWCARYRTRLQAEGSVCAQRQTAMLAVNPKYILRNYLAQQAIELASEDRDASEIERLVRCLSHPFDEQPEFEAYAALPPAWACEISVSCSS